jgi:uncharacterized protein YdaU (DUF1376 family)
MMEDLAYRRLLDRYYDTEKPLESDVEKLCRFIRMTNQKKETQQVLDEFFTLTKKGWIQKRVQKELGAYSLKADTARANGKKGGRPKITQSVSSGLDIGTQEKAKQEPLNKNHKPLNKENKTDYAVFNMSDVQIEEVRRIRKKNKGGTITQRVADGLAKEFNLALSLGHTVDHLLTEWEMRGWKSFKAEWIKGDNQSLKPTKSFIEEHTDKSWRDDL